MSHQPQCEMGRKLAAGERRDWDDADKYENAVCSCIDIGALQADNARLRALIAEKEQTRCGDQGDGWSDSYDECPWCRGGIGAIMHTADCPAFSAPGVVR